MSSHTFHSVFMRLALAQGRLALPGCLPNPPVGCVLVQNNLVVSAGLTQPPGHYHAEAMALSLLPGDRAGVTAFVTLEPCSFHGRTPSCALALVNSGVEKVFVGMLDPDPRNSGAGVKILRDAGITVVVGLLAEEAAKDLAGFLMSKPNGSMAPGKQTCVDRSWPRVCKKRFAKVRASTLNLKFIGTSADVDFA